MYYIYSQFYTVWNYPLWNRLPYIYKFSRIKFSRGADEKLHFMESIKNREQNYRTHRGWSFFIISVMLLLSININTSKNSNPLTIKGTCVCTQVMNFFLGKTTWLILSNEISFLRGKILISEDRQTFFATSFIGYKQKNTDFFIFIVIYFN